MKTSDREQAQRRTGLQWLGHVYIMENKQNPIAKH